MSDVVFYEYGDSVRQMFTDEKGFRKTRLDLVVKSESYQAMIDYVVKHGRVFQKYEQSNRILGEMSFVDLKTAVEESVTAEITWWNSDIEEFLCRKDFTCNSLAIDYRDGAVLDFFNGKEDITNKVLRCVNYDECFSKFPLRILKALRLSMYLGFELDENIVSSLHDKDTILLLDRLSDESIRDELLSMFAFDTLTTLKAFEAYPILRDNIFVSGILGLYPVNSRLA
jgi:hypothetical protein